MKLLIIGTVLFGLAAAAQRAQRHFLLADVYAKTGLDNIAAEEYGESDFLLKQR